MDWIELKKDTVLLDGIWVACVAEIKNNETGEIVEYETSEVFIHGQNEPDIYIWEEGNYACDCNRHLFFMEAKKEPRPDNSELKCTTDKYSVNLKNKKNGNVYYREFE